MMELTKFKLSGLNTLAAYSAYFAYAPLGGVGLFDSMLFLAAT